MDVGSIINLVCIIEKVLNKRDYIGALEYRAWYCAIEINRGRTGSKERAAESSQSLNYILKRVARAALKTARAIINDRRLQRAARKSRAYTCRMRADMIQASRVRLYVYRMALCGRLYTRDACMERFYPQRCRIGGSMNERD